MNLLIDNNGDKPIYEQIFNAIRGEILSGELCCGDMLPSMRVLARELRVSIITTKRAYEELERAGYIKSYTGRGSFVSQLDTDAVANYHNAVVTEKVQELLEIASSYGISSENVKMIIDKITLGSKR